MSDKPKQADFSFETVAVLVCAILMQGGTISTKSYELMSALDGTRTANSFQHGFRAVLRRARELKEEQDKGTELKAVVPKPKGRVKAPNDGKTIKEKKNGVGMKGVKRARAIKVKEEDEDDAAVGDDGAKRMKCDSESPAGWSNDDYDGPIVKTEAA
ncbi:hypothetical protein CAC42_5093 [Sphaceloma murrayae]|uniref:Uncharacterized protein n=1 Tax=Sphaceloma murrayae TaxID=2082308 RepID=A0A2K1QU08_9PEZI|nr:hypothetical protein CAC42_5093 [Sphaceloma murrayae]